MYTPPPQPVDLSSANQISSTSETTGMLSANTPQSEMDIWSVPDDQMDLPLANLKSSGGDGHDPDGTDTSAYLYHQDQPEKAKLVSSFFTWFGQTQTKAIRSERMNSKNWDFDFLSV